MSTITKNQSVNYVVLRIPFLKNQPLSLGHHPSAKFPPSLKMFHVEHFYMRVPGQLPSKVYQQDRNIRRGYAADARCLANVAGFCFLKFFAGLHADCLQSHVVKILF